jgi:amino acid transporter
MAQPATRQFDYGHPDDPRQHNMYDSNEYKGKEGDRIVDGGSAPAADDLLNVLGYQSELTRSRSTLQVAFMSFVLASVPYGLSTTLYYPLIGGGPVAVIWGWVAVCLIILCLAISLGEITSVYPTAGGVYYQTYMLSPPWCRNITAWICGWCYFLGNVTITLAVNFGTTLFLIGCINIFTDADGNPIWATQPYQVFLTFLAITFLCNAISSLLNKWLPLLDVRIFCR